MRKKRPDAEPTVRSARPSVEEVVAALLWSPAAADGRTPTKRERARDRENRRSLKKLAEKLRKKRKKDR